MSKQKTKPRNFIVKGTIYPFDVMFSIDESDKQLTKTLKTIIPKGTDLSLLMDLPTSNRGRSVRLTSGQHVIRLRENGINNSEFAGTIAHEIFHVATFVLDQVGLTFSLENNDEAYAYLIGYLTKSFYRNYLRTGNEA